MGFYIGLATQSILPTYRGIALNEPPFVERGGAQSLVTYMENASEISFEEVLKNLIHNTQTERGISIFKVYREKIQRNRTTKTETKEIVEKLLNDNRTATEILRLIQTGYQCSISVIDFIINEWKDERSSLEIYVESALVKKRPDFFLVKNENPIKSKSGISKLLAIGDVKSFHSFVMWSKEKFLSEYIDQLVFDEWSTEKLDKFNLKKEKAITMSDFHKITGAISKYLKIIKYCDLYYEKLKVEPEKVLLFIILPGAISTINIESPNHLQKILNFFKQLIPTKIRRYGSRDIDFDTDRRSYIFDLIYNEGMYIRKKTKENTTTFTFSGAEEQELKYALKSQDMSYRDVYPSKSQEEEPTIIHETRNVEDINELWKNHEKDFLKALNNDKYDIIINGSEQGIGKNHSLICHIENLIKAGKSATILYLCPRIITILQMKKKLEERIKVHKNKEISISHTISRRDLLLILNKTYKHMEIVHKRAGEKIAEELKNDYKIKVIFSTSQAIVSFVKNRNNKNLLLSKTDIIVFDELIASCPLTRRTFIDLIQLAKEYQKLNSKLPKFIVMDASITNFYLVKRMLKKLLNDTDNWYFPFSSTYHKENTKVVTWDIERFSICYIRHTLDFNIQYAIGSCRLSSKYMNRDCVIEVLPQIEKLVRKAKISNEFANLLKEGKVIFYVDNKQMVDSLLEQLKENNFTAIAITAESPYLEEESPEQNIIGTSSLAFGANFPHHELFVILPPSISKSDYFETTRNIELFRQVVKRMRGEDISKSSKTRLVVILSLLSNSTSITTQRITHYALSGFVKNHLVNKEYHVLASFSKSVNTQFGSQMSLFDTRTKRPYVLSSVSLDSLLKDYLPSIRNALNYFDLFIKLGFILEFDTSGKWENIPTPLFSFYKLSKQQIAKYFKIRIYPGKECNIDKFIEYLINPKGYYTVEKGLSFLEMIVKSKYHSTKPNNQSEKFPYLLEFILVGKKEGWSLATRIEKLLSPEFIHASNSFILATIDLTDEIVVSDEYNRETLRKLRSIGSPLKSIYFGDMELYEEPMRVIITGRDLSPMSYGYIINHPKFGKNPNQVKRLLSDALSAEMVRENTLILPKIVKYLIS